MDYRTRIRNLREDNDYTQSYIGTLLQKSQQGYNHIEIGRAELKIEDLAILCKLYNVSADYIIGLIQTPKSYDR
ncbi:MAG: helix-turn-helix transcriptional regulator [Clostridia bacterium]|nr:helix-turn-helix transcriptional regulator [Clostridia bacterium]